MVVGGTAALGGVGAQETGEAGNQATDSFEVESITAPDSAAPGSNVTVVATVENPTADRTTQSVEFRVGGQVVDRDLVTIEGNATETVRLSADTTGLPAGTYTHGVFTEGDGQTAEITLSESFTLDGLDAPASATTNDTVVVNATVTNPNDVATTQDVQFRLAGGLVAEQSVALDADETRTVTFEAPLSGVSPGTYVHAVFTRDDGQFATLSVTEPEPSDNETEVPDNETEVPDNETEMPDNETEMPPEATVTFSDQSTDGTTVTVDSVTLSEGGYVAVHDSSLLEGEVVGSVIGVSEFLEAGTHEDVTITLYEVPGGDFEQSELAADETLIAMPHQETSANEEYDFVRTNGNTDGAYVSDGEPVTDAGNVTVG